MLVSGEVLAGRYRIDGLLGAGGMATVHRAHDLRLGRDVAVKMLAANLAANAIALGRFGREARAMAALAHPNLVAIHDVGWADEAGQRGPFLVMELVTGGTLAERLEALGPLDPAEVVTLAEGLSGALAALHRAGIVHRDVKPQNVLLAPTGPKLGDLGVIRVDEPDGSAGNLTATEATPGTLKYLAPEVLHGQAAGPKSDAYALAMVAFEALTGRPPRAAATLGELVDATWRPVARVSDMRPEVGTRFDAVFAQALDLDPARRLDASAFASALREAMRDQVHTAATASASTAPTEFVPVVPLGRGLAPDPADAGSDRRRAAAYPLIGAVLIGATLALVAVIVLSAPGPRSPIDTAAVPPTSPSAVPIVASQPPSSPTASAAVAVSSVELAFAQVRAAIDEARAGGLKGGEANDLGKRVDDVERALDEDETEKAAEKADELAKRVRELVDKEEIGRAAAASLRAAVEELVDLIEGD